MMNLGINLAFAQLLAQKGAHVVVADVQESPAFRTFQHETKSTKVLFQKTDVSSWKDLEKLFAFAKAELGTIDLLCNGAGVFEPVRLPLRLKQEMA
jgi:3-hydroxybutyrate dehydrogenase